MKIDKGVGALPVRQRGEGTENKKRDKGEVGGEPKH